jgi:competence ComEA-like helix-hairpin-helix protein
MSKIRRTIDQISKKFGLTRQEFSVVLFLLIFFFAGIAGYYLKYKTEYKEYKNYNYEKQDSLYNSAYAADSNKNLMEKVVDSKQELLDFSKDDKTIEDNKVLLESSVNINTASINELVLLPGIGEKTAEKIINLRSLKGKFSKLEELLEVKGIGEAKLNKISKFITLE